MAVGFDIMNMILVKRHCLLERVWKRLSARCASQFAGMIFQIRSGMMSFLREILRALEV
jgi:hypothetical protein